MSSKHQDTKTCFATSTVTRGNVVARRLALVSMRPAVLLQTEEAAAVLKDAQRAGITTSQYLYERLLIAAGVVS